MIYRIVVKRVNPKHFHHKENFFLLFLLLHLYEKMDVSWTYCGNHFTIYVIGAIMLYILNVYSDICQLLSIKLKDMHFYLINWKKNPQYPRIFWWFFWMKMNCKQNQMRGWTFKSLGKQHIFLSFLHYKDV